MIEVSKGEEDYLGIRLLCLAFFSFFLVYQYIISPVKVCFSWAIPIITYEVIYL